MLKSCIFKALALYHLDKPKEALSFYNQSLELDPNDAKTYFNRFLILLLSDVFLYLLVGLLILFWLVVLQGFLFFDTDEGYYMLDNFPDALFYIFVC